MAKKEGSFWTINEIAQAAATAVLNAMVSSPSSG